jgi:hypothetical protein
MRKKNYLLLFFLVYIVGCSSKQQLLEGVELNENSILYFYNLPDDSANSELATDSLRSKHGNFYINDKRVLSQIKNEWVFEKSKKKLPLRSFYRVNLMEKNRIIWGCLLDTKNNALITQKGTLDFDIDLIEKHAMHFKKLDGFIVKCEKITMARTLYESLIENEVFVPVFVNKKGENPLYLYDGNTKITLKAQYISNFDFNVIEKEVIGDIEKIPDARVNHISGSSENKLVLIEVYSKKDILQYLQDKYEVVNSFEELKDIEMPIFGVTRESLERIIYSLDIQDHIEVIEL